MSYLKMGHGPTIFDGVGALTSMQATNIATAMRLFLSANAPGFDLGKAAAAYTKAGFTFTPTSMLADIIATLCEKNPTREDQSRGQGLAIVSAYAATTGKASADILTEAKTVITGTATVKLAAVGYAMRALIADNTSLQMQHPVAHGDSVIGPLRPSLPGAFKIPGVQPPGTAGGGTTPIDVHDALPGGFGVVAVVGGLGLLGLLGWVFSRK